MSENDKTDVSQDEENRIDDPNAFYRKAGVLETRRNINSDKIDPNRDREQIFGRDGLRAHDYKYITKISKEISELGESASKMLVGSHLLAVGRLKAEGNEDNSNLDMMVGAGPGKQYYREFIESMKVQKTEDYLKQAFIFRHTELPTEAGIILKGGKLKRWPTRYLRGLENKYREKRGLEPKKQENLSDPDSKRRALFHKMMMRINPGEQREIRELIQHEDAKKRFDHAYLGGIPDEKDPDLAKMPFGKEGREAITNIIRSNEFSDMTEQAASEELVMYSIYAFLAEKKGKYDKTLQEYKEDPTIIRPEEISDTEWEMVRSKKVATTKELMTEEEFELFSQNDPYFESKVNLMSKHNEIAQQVEDALHQMAWEDPEDDSINLDIPVTKEGSPDYQALFHEDAVSKEDDSPGRIRAVPRINIGKGKLRLLHKQITEMTYEDMVNPQNGFIHPSMIPGYNGNLPAQPLSPDQFDEIKRGIEEQFYTQLNRSVVLGKASIRQHSDGTTTSHVRFPSAEQFDKTLGPNMALAAGNISLMYQKQPFERKKAECQKSVQKMTRGKIPQRAIHHMKRHGATYVAIYQRGQMIYHMGNRTIQESAKRDHSLEQLLQGGN